MMPCYMFTVTCQLLVFGLLYAYWCVLWGVMWRGQSVCDCVWGVEAADWHVDVWVLLHGACCVEWFTRLLLLLRSCVVLMLFYNLDYG